VLTLHRLPRSYRVLYVGVAALLAAAVLSHWLRLGLRHGMTPDAVAAWYRGNEASMLFPKSAVEVADDAWMNLFHHTLAFLVLGGLVVRTTVAAPLKAGLAVLFGSATLVSAAGPALVWRDVPGTAALYVAALAALSSAALVVLGLVCRDAVLRRGSGPRGVAGTDVLARALLAAGALLVPGVLAGQTLLTERQALHKVFPTARLSAVDTLRPDSAARAALEQRLGRPLYEPAFVVRRLYGPTRADFLGYALVTEERGKYRPITMLIGVDTALRVAGVQILVYREPRGGEVSREYFLRQYRGKSTGDPIRLNRDIINISGATISVQSVSAAVRKTLAVLERYTRNSAFAAPRAILPLEDIL
jgi:Na+-translocating ferredoxin:NAD+ oxidoreductase RnfG subunit